MAFRLKRGRSLGRELTRAYNSQVDAAIAGLTGAADGGTHAVRKHVKKARALLRAAAAADAPGAADAERALKIANRSLGRLADAERIADVTERLRGFDRALLPDATIERMRTALISRGATFDESAERAGTRAGAARLLDSVRTAPPGWTTTGITAAMLAEAARDAHHRARAARRLARRHPSIQAFHRWRRRVKAEWYLFRIIGDHTGDRLQYDRNRLAALDGCLGELHDLDVLAEVLRAESILPRPETAAALRAIRGAARDLRRHADVLSVVLDDSSHDVRRRIEMLWGAPAAATTERVWPASA